MSARIIGRAGMRLAALLGVLLLAAPASAAPDDFERIERGRYLATVGDCVACHRGPNGPYGGGTALETPFGNIYPPNITPDRVTGIGAWSADDFWNAMHNGVRPDGAHLYPGFPYPNFTKVTRADSDAIFAFLQTLPPVNAPRRPTELPFPLNIRFAMFGWNMLFFSPGEFVPDPGKPAEWNRGAYLVEGLGHCGACHTAKNFLGADSGTSLGGGMVQGWTAPALTSDSRTGLGAWSVEEVMEFLRTGRNVRSAASGIMAEAVEHSTHAFTESDLRAIAVYLKSLPGDGADAPAPVAASDPTMRQGAAIYADGCQACHRGDGQGVEGIFPRLAGNQIAQQAEPAGLIRMVLAGSRAAATDAAPTAPAMPPFGWRLSDEEVAAVTTFVRNSWGNAGPAVTAADVAAQRGRLAGR